MTGIDRDEDYVEAEREEPACLLLRVGDAAPRARVRWKQPRSLEAVRERPAGRGAPVS